MIYKIRHTQRTNMTKYAFVQKRHTKTYNIHALAGTDHIDILHFLTADKASGSICIPTNESLFMLF
jgi:hypothetical protein